MGSQRVDSGVVGLAMTVFTFSIGYGEWPQLACNAPTISNDDVPFFQVFNTLELTSLRPRERKLLLANYSLRQRSEYRKITVVSQCHVKPTTDVSLDSSQPFLSPKPHLASDVPLPPRTLQGVGNIYNFKEIVTRHSLKERDLWGECDLSLPLAMWVEKAALFKTLDGILSWMLPQIEGDFLLAGTENVVPKGLDLSDVKAWVASDRWGKMRLHYAACSDRIIFASSEDLLPSSLPDDTVYGVMPPGHFWTFRSSFIPVIFTSYVSTDVTMYTPINFADPDTVDEACSRIWEALSTAVSEQITQGLGSYAFLLSGDDASLILLYVAVSSGVVGSGDTLYLFTNPEDQRRQARAIAKVTRLAELYPSITFTLNSLSVSWSNTMDCTYHLVKVLAPDVSVVVTGTGLRSLMTATEPVIDVTGTDVALASTYGLSVKTPYLATSFVSSMLSLSLRLREPQYYNGIKYTFYIVLKSLESHVSANVLWLE